MHPVVIAVYLRSNTQQAPSTALTLMNEKDLRRTSDSLGVLVRIEKLSTQVSVDSGRRSPYRRDGS